MESPDILSAGNTRALLEPKVEQAADGWEERDALGVLIAARSNRASSL